MNKLTARERVKLALDHKEPDRVPIDFGGTRQTSIHIFAYNELRKQINLSRGLPKLFDFVDQLALPEIEIMDYLQTDVINIAHSFLKSDQDWKEFIIPNGNIKCLIPKYLDKLSDFVIAIDKDLTVLVKYKDGTILGKMPKSSSYVDPTYWPYGNMQKLPGVFKDEDRKKILWEVPIVDSHLDLLNRKVYKSMADDIRNLYENQDRAIIYFIGGSLFSAPASYRKEDNFYCDLYLDKKGVMRVVNKLLDDYLKDIERVLKSVGEYIEAVHFFDDFGSQRSLIIPPEKYREIFKPGHKKMWDYIHENSNCKVLYHSCGSIYHIIPDLIDAGMDILNPVQISATNMEPEKLKKEFGKYISFWGGGCDSKILAFGSLKEIKEEVKKNIDIFNKGGGFVFAPILTITPEVPPKNIIAMYESAFEFGFY